MECPICREMLENSREEKTDEYYYKCPRCGEFKLSRTLAKIIKSWEDGVWRWVFSYNIRSMNINGREVELNSGNVEYFKKLRMPRPSEQIENFMRYLGDRIQLPSGQFQFHGQIFASYIGTDHIGGVDYIANYLKQKGYITYINAGQGTNERIVSLTVEGWKYYESLHAGQVNTNLAFMAMKYNDLDLDIFYNDYLKPEMENLNFNLRRLDELPKAGLIDNHLRVEIQKSRLILADLTFANNGAYWEAGYAEGLSKPVIYLCRRDYFDSFKTHFDTNHHTTIIWSMETILNDIKRLRATIQNTFPELKYF